MPAIRKLFPIGAAVILMIGAAGHRYEATALVKPDSTDLASYGYDTKTPGALENDNPREKTLASITPDLTGLVRAGKKRNPDTVGWLSIPGTEIDQVILQNPPKLADNKYYLNVDFQVKPDKNGCFCTDYRVKTGSGRRDELSRNTTIYGHSWTDDPDGALFAQLKRFRDPEFARKTPYIFYSTRAETMAWEVFAVFDTTIELPYITPDPSNKRFYDTLDIIYELSLYSYDCAIAPGDKILTLSTCTYSTVDKPELPEFNDYRFVVMARLVPSGGSVRDEAVFAVNGVPLSPDMIAERMARQKKQ